jgi:transposase, IS6 family
MTVTMRCIFCLKERPGSEEHVFPLAIGGTLTTDRVCEPCNSTLGSRVDSALTDNFAVRIRRAELGLAGNSGTRRRMIERRQPVQVSQNQSFKGRQFTAEAIRWYLMFPISYRDLMLMLLDRGVAVDHSTIFRWIQAYSAELEKRIRPHLRVSNGSWRVDETYVKVKGRWMYLYRAVDSCGQTIDFLLSAKRDANAAKRFFRKALAQPHTVNPRTITVDKNAAYPKAATEMKKDGELWRRSRLRQVKYLNNIVEQDHRRVKRLTGPGLGFGGFWTARRTLAGYEAMAMIKKGQVRNISGGDIKAQAVFIAGLFQVAA